MKRQVSSRIFGNTVHFSEMFQAMISNKIMLFDIVICFSATFIHLDAQYVIYLSLQYVSEI